MTDEFKTAAEVDMRLAEVRAQREEGIAVLKDHFDALKDKEMRGVLLKDAVYDALRTTKSFRFIAGFLKRWDQ